jgi:hypothetical protein
MNKVVVAEQPWETHYWLKAYLIDSRDQFQFTSDLAVWRKQALSLLAVKASVVLPIHGLPAN